MQQERKQKAITGKLLKSDQPVTDADEEVSVPRWQAPAERTELAHIVNLDALRERALLPHSACPRPFLRWAGSKRYLLGSMIEHLPRAYGTYFEPFLGAGSLFFLLQPSSAVLSDKCRPLVHTFEAVRDNVSAVIRYMSPLSPTRRCYYEIRAADPRGRFRRAANFIYLNYTCWNGLYRVNASGKFNVPFGQPKTRNLADPENLKACATALGRPDVHVLTADFEQAVSAAKAGDLVYFDPPYVTKHNTNGFRDYNESLFHWNDQVRLASVAAELVRRRVTVLVSNARHADVEALYPDFVPIVLERKSTLASNAKFRGRTEELLLVSKACVTTGGPA